MKSILCAVVSLMLLAGCSASTEVVELGNGFKRYFSRGGVDVGDCGTQLVSDLFYTVPGKQEQYVGSHSERGHALHCDLSVAIIEAGATVGAANQIRRGLAGAAGTTISNANENTQGDQINTQTQGQSQEQGQYTGIKVKDISGGSSGDVGKGHGNNGYGNGGNDGSPNGKSDNGR